MVDGNKMRMVKFTRNTVLMLFNKFSEIRIPNTLYIPYLSFFVVT